LASRCRGKVLYYSTRCGGHDLKFIRCLKRVSDEVLAVFRDGTTMLWRAETMDRGLLTRHARPVHSQSAAVARLKSLVHEFCPTITVAGPLWPCASEAALAKAPNIVATSWAFDVLVHARRSPAIRRAIGFALKSATMQIFDSPWILEQANKIQRFPVAHAHVFPWGVDTRLFCPLAHSNHQTSTDFTIFHTRALETIYRPQIVIRAFHKVLKARPDLHIKIIAHGSLLGKMRKLAKSLAIDGSVEWVAPVPNSHLPEMYRTSSVYTCASESDGVSISLLEAMASGLPVAVPNLPSNRQVLSPRHVAQTFELHDVSSLASRLLSIASLSEAARRSIGNANRSKVSRTASLANFERCYENAIKVSLRKSMGLRRGR
jgi:glycosyltransferase involved in cell wall biosynthesis